MKLETLVIAVFVLSLVAGAVWLLGLSGIAAILIAIGLGLNFWWIIMLLAPGDVIFALSLGNDRDACVPVLAASVVGIAFIGLGVLLLALQ